MYIKKCDLISPKITLYFKGSNKHSSIISGIITIISYSIIIGFIIYYIIDFINKETPTIYFYNRYNEEAGFFPLNSSSIFHYLNLISTSKVKNITFDFNSIRISGISKSIDKYLENHNLTEFDHWVYGYCNYDIDTNELNKIINKNIFSQSICIKKFYNSNIGKFFNINESDFKWPILEHGSSHPNHTTYGIIVEKCYNDSFKNDCNSNEIINQYIKRYGISLNFIDQYTNILNYLNPFIKYINSITTGLASEALNVNNLNFNPIITKTHNGIFMENLVEDKSYSFYQNEKITINPQNKNIIVAFYFLMQNNMIFNERYYKKFQDLLSNIGGLGSFILLIGVIINSLFTYYITLLDTEDLVFNIDKLNFSKVDINRKSFLYAKTNDKLYSKKYYSNKNQTKYINNSNYPLFIKEKFDTENISCTDIKKPELSKYLFLKNKRNNNYEGKIISGILPKNKNIKFKNEILNLNQPNYNLESIDENSFESKRFSIKKNFFEIKDKNNKTINKPSRKNNFTYCNYVLYILFFKTKYSKIKFYENFRTQMISEENLIQNHLDIYKLLKSCNLKKNNPFEFNYLSNS